MADMCDTCGDGVVELLRKILDQERDSFARLFQINQNIASSDLTTENSNINGINGVTPAVGCGVATTGTLRVAQATDCNVQVVGNVASDAVDSGNPVKIGFQARTTQPVAVANGDRVDGIADKFGRQIVQHHIRDLRGNQHTTITSSIAETTIVTANATAMLDVYGLVIANSSATATTVTIKDATAGTTRFVFAVPANDTRGFMLPASDGHKQAAVNNNWTATVGASVASIHITALFAQNAS